MPDEITQTVAYPDHISNIPPNRKQQINCEHKWHLRLNHIASAKLTQMARMSLLLCLPTILAGATAKYHCQGCSLEHFKRATQNAILLDRPPDTPLSQTEQDHFQIQLRDTCTSFHRRISTRTGALLNYSNGGTSLKSRSLPQWRRLRDISNRAAKKSCDNSNEYMTKVLPKHNRARATCIYPATPNTKQVNNFA